MLAQERRIGTTELYAYREANLTAFLNSRFISENPIVAKVQYWMKICFVFILILFIDSVNRVYRVQSELVAASEGSNKTGYVFCRFFNASSVHLPY